MTQQQYDALTATFNIKDAYEISNEERLLCHGEIDALISPLLYGETIHASLETFILALREKGLFTGEGA